MGRSFIDAINYTNLNKDLWNRMYYTCFNDWRIIYGYECDSSLFQEYLLDTYGIRHHPLPFNESNYYVVDEKKYLFFQLKYSNE